METRSLSETATQVEADALILAKFADRDWDQHAQAVDSATGGQLQRLLDAERIRGENEELIELPVPGGVTAKSVVVIGLGNHADADDSVWRSFGAAAKSLAGRKNQRVVVAVDDLSSQQVAHAVAAMAVGCVGQDRYRTDKRLNEFESLGWLNGDDDGLSRGVILGDAINLTRELVNEPANVIYPESFAARAESLVKETGLECEIWDSPKLEAERCGALLAVARGSTRPPRLVILRYRPAEDNGDAPLVLVGKGVTFDSGGLSLKPSEGMKTMKCDMAGAATVLGAMDAIARLKPKTPVVGIMGLAENMVSGDSYKLGDVLVSRSGKTIEVLNTDAEGRLVLADALDVAQDEKPSRVIDLATLTGACVVALGLDVAGLMTNDQDWCDTIAAAAQSNRELAWQLPMMPLYNELIKSQVADIKNVGEGRWGGAITAAKFLEEFVDPETPWTHIDIAGPAFLDSAKPWQDGGATGAFVRTLVTLAEQ